MKPWDMSKNSLYFKVFYFDMAKSRTIRINEPAEDKAMSMFSPEEQRQLIDLSRTYTKNLTELINQEMEEWTWNYTKRFIKKPPLIWIGIYCYYHSWGASVINTDNKLITLAHVGKIIRINQRFKRKVNTIKNNL